MSVLIKRISSTASSTRRIAPFSGGVLTSGLGSKVNVCGGGFFSERPVETLMGVLPQLALPSTYLRGRPSLSFGHRVRPTSACQSAALATGAAADSTLGSGTRYPTTAAMATTAMAPSTVSAANPKRV